MTTTSSCFFLLTRRGEDRTDILGDLRLHVFVWQAGLSVVLEMKLTPLPGNPAEDRQACGSQTCMIVA